MSEKARRPMANPEGFEVVSFAIPPMPVKMPNVLPTREAYRDIILRLSERLIGPEPYSEPTWSEHDGEVVRFRQTEAPLPIPGLNFMVREKHDVEGSSPESLMRMYGTDSGLGVMLEHGRLIQPLRLSVYDPRDDVVRDVVMRDLPVESVGHIFDMADIEIATGRAGEDSLLARHALYLGLTFAAGEMPPAIQAFEGYEDFRP